MNKILIATLLLCASCEAHQVGDRLFANPQTGQPYVGHYYVYSVKDGCYYWQKVPYQQGASYDSHAQTFTFNITNYQPQAQRGNTVYGVADSGYTYGQPFDPNKAFHLASELQQFTQKTAADGYNQLATFGYQAHQNQLELEKERTQALKIQALAQLAESTKAQPSASFVRQQIGTAVEAIGAAVTNDAALASGSAKCMTCHADGQKANGIVLPPIASMTPAMKEKVYERLTTLDMDANMAHRAQLTPQEHKALLAAFK